MQNSVVHLQGGGIGSKMSATNHLGQWRVTVAAMAILGLAVNDLQADTTTSDPSDPILNLFLQKGFITQSEADKAKAEVQAMRTNELSELPPPSRWKMSDGIKDLEFFGDVRLRYEDRSATAPNGGSIDLNRYRYAIRLGFRGEAFDDFYYGFRLETGSNPRSSMVTLGGSSPGPYGKSATGISIGQVYLGWKPESWFDFTVGKMPNPLYTTPMVWSPSINPEGLAERFKYDVGPAEFFGTFAQFIYQDQNPVGESENLGLTGQTSQNIFQVAWQGGVTYQITTNITAKVGATMYEYYGLQQSTSTTPGISPYFGDTYVGEGAYNGFPGSENGASGYSSGSTYTLAGQNSLNYPNNQVGLNDLSVLEIPFQLDFRIKRWDARIFGDFAYNFQGRQRAEAASSAYNNWLQIGQSSGVASPLSGFAPQTHENKAYQIGFALGSRDALGLVNGTTSYKHAWEVRTYWQHIEQYSLDPNLLDLDFFSAAENLQGVYVAAAYGFSANFIGTFRYGYASRINNLLGTGGTGTDIPQINPIDQYQIFQADLTFRF